jgi:hypothetical protein
MEHRFVNPRAVAAAFGTAWYGLLIAPSHFLRFSRVIGDERTYAEKLRESYDDLSRSREPLPLFLAVASGTALAVLTVIVLLHA